MVTKELILEFIASHKEQFINDFGVVRIGLFGSYARSEAHEGSDVDIAVELKRENKAANYFKLLHFLQDALHVEVDLGVESALKPAVKEQIKQEIIYV